jgi:superoxide dismutase, Fe-Mn family
MKTTRRDFIEKTLKGVAVTTVGALLPRQANAFFQNDSRGNALQFSQITLPYAYHALEPYIDAQTMEIHYSKHHAAYVKNVNESISLLKTSHTVPKKIFLPMLPSYLRKREIMAAVYGITISSGR